MSTILFLALAAVFLVGVFGILVADSFVGEPDEVPPLGLDERLAMIRATQPARRTRRTSTASAPAPYYVRATRRR